MNGCHEQKYFVNETIFLEKLENSEIETLYNLQYWNDRKGL